MLDYKVNFDYYSVLEIASTATSKEIKKAYRKLALKHHPDKGGDQEKFKALSEAYEILIDDETRASYDFERSYLETNTFGDTSNAYHGAEHHVAPISKNTMVFNTTHQVPLSQNTSIVPSNNTHHVASAGIKAEDMSPTELFNLAMTTEYVALALATDMTQLMRLNNTKIASLAIKHPSFAYQVLACPETRIFLYEIYSFDLVKLLKNDYHLLLLIAGSEVLTNTLLYRRGKPNLNGTELHEIYNIHLEHRGSCQAFELLLEANEQLDALFKNHRALQSQDGHGHRHARYELYQLELLDFSELSQLALNNKDVAVMITHHSQLLDKFRHIEYRVIDILVKHPNECMDDFFNSPHSFYFPETAIVHGCKNSRSFLLHILNSPKEFKTLNGYNLEEIIGHDSEKKTDIYAYPDLKLKHENYKNLLALLTTADVLETRTQNTYQAIINNFGKFSVNDLSSIITELSTTYEHKILAINSAFLMDCYQVNTSYCTYRLSEISVDFFHAIYEKPSLRSSCYDDLCTYWMCEKSYEITEILLQDSEAVTMLTDEQLYRLQQTWINFENSHLSEIFNNNPDLMQRWHRGYEITKLHQNVVVSDYAEQSALRHESDLLTQTRSLMHSLQLHFTFSKISFSEENHEFISWLFEQDDWLTKLTTLQSINHLILPGLFWFLACADKPVLLNDDLPLDYINQQLEQTLAALKNNQTDKAINITWLLKPQAIQDNKIIYHLLPTSEQQASWFNLLLTKTDIQDQYLWLNLLEDPTFIQKFLYHDDIIRDFEQLLTDISKLGHQKQMILYLVLLNHKQVTLVDFLKDKHHIAVLKQSNVLQQYFIENFQNEIQTDLFEIIDSYCKQDLFTHALVIFSLMYQSQLEENIDNLLPNYSDTHTQYLNTSYYKSAIFIGLTSLLIEIGFVIALCAMPIMLSLAIAASALLVAIGTYGYINEEPVYESVSISYQESLARMNSAMFFQASETSEPNNSSSVRVESTI